VDFFLLKIIELNQIYNMAENFPEERKMMEGVYITGKLCVCINESFN